LSENQLNLEVKHWKMSENWLKFELRFLCLHFHYEIILDNSIAFHYVGYLITYINTRYSATQYFILFFVLVTFFFFLFFSLYLF